MRTSIILLILLFSVSNLSFASDRQHPAVEVRAVWLTTNFGLDWPSSRMGTEAQKEHLRKILDELQQSNFNTVFFQIRIRGDVFYYSDIEPMSPFARKDFDALNFAIDECHKRGMECHAWFVTYPVGSKKQVAAHGKNSIVRKRPDLCKLYNGEWYLDPGNPDTQKYLLSLVDEIVKKYDIDGIHFDYIRYPEKAVKFPDTDTYKKYRKGQNLADWRRSNINRLVEEIYSLVKKQKPWVQISSAPIGKYKNLNYNKGSWTAYESVHQDAAHWLQTGTHDALYPMMYYKDEDFYPFLDDWMKNSYGLLIAPGLGVYQMLPQEKNWDSKIITDQIEYTRKNNIKGQAYFRAGNIINNVKNINTILKQSYYKYPAKLPPMSRIDNVAPNSPVDLEVFINEKGKLRLQWQPEDRDETLTYTIYCSPDEDIDTNNAENIIATGIRANQIELEIAHGDYGLHYSITASDRYHNESVPCFPAYFVHSEKYEK